MFLFYEAMIVICGSVALVSVKHVSCLDGLWVCNVTLTIYVVAIRERDIYKYTLRRMGIGQQKLDQPQRPWTLQCFS